jgi:hypothetical protein
VTRRQELLVGAGVVLLILAAGALLLVRPKQQAVAEARADRNASAAESQALGDQIRALEALKADEPALQAKARQGPGRVPADTQPARTGRCLAGRGQPGRRGPGLGGSVRAQAID